MIDFSGLRVKLLHPYAKLPTKAHFSAGYDLYCIDYWDVSPGHRVLIPLGIATEMPYGYFGKLMDRSGLAAREGLTVLGGVIDNDYRGEWKVILFNTSGSTVHLKPGDRIAQVVFMVCGHFEVHEVENLSDTERGPGGFGSTGQ